MSISHLPHRTDSEWILPNLLAGGKVADENSRKENNRSADVGCNVQEGIIGGCRQLITQKAAALSQDFAVDKQITGTDLHGRDDDDRTATGPRSTRITLGATVVRVRFPIAAARLIEINRLTWCPLSSSFASSIY